MKNAHFSPADRFLPILKEFSEMDLSREIETPRDLRMASHQHNGKRVDIAYAPFDYINFDARVVIVGITPGRRQMSNALSECRQQLRSGASQAEALAVAKVHASFSGPMRANLVAMLDHIGVAGLLGLDSTADLWGSAAGMVHFTSALRYPVFIDGKNYSGTPSMLRVPLLQDHLGTWLAEEMRQLPNALFVPLGPKVSEALAYLAPKVGIRENQVLTGLPHPSGASAERVAYFLGQKPRELLSAKTNAARLDTAKASLVAKIHKLGEIA